MSTTQKLIVPLLANGSIIRDGSGNISVDVLPAHGLDRDGVGRLRIDVATARTSIAHVLTNGGI